MALNTSALYFNNTANQYVKLPTAVSVRGLSSFSLALHFSVGANALLDTQDLYRERQGTGTLARLRATIVKGKLQFGFSAKDGVADTSYTYNTTWDDRWHHAVFTVRMSGDSPTYEILLDSVSVAEGTLIIPAEVEAVSDTAPKGVYIGNYSKLNTGESFSQATAWNGFVDEVILFNTSVSQGEANDYTTAKEHWELPDEDVISYWKFDENTGTTTTDAAVARTATLYQNGVASSALWTINRPFLGDGLLDTTAPSTPTANAETNITEDGFDTTWTTSTDNVWVQFYELQVSEFADFSSYIAYDMGRLQAKQVRGLLPATNYYWRVRAFDAELNASVYSNVRSLTTALLSDVAPPSAPTNLGVSFLTHNSFRITFTQSVSVDATGYKIDVSTSETFDDYLTSYRNQDIGNVSYIDIGGVEPLTSYYIRLRAYDPYANESNDSVALRVNTPRRPDITPPEVATMVEPIGVGSRSATIRWLEGVDDTGVIGYYLDLATTSNFGEIVTANNIYWDNVDVGNVIEYRIEDLTPDTTYYARVRAYDDADNIAGNVETPLEFTTASPSIYEGDPLTSSLLSPVVLTYDSDYDATSIGIEEESTINLLNNPRLGVNASWWVAGPNASLGRVTTQTDMGPAQLEVTCTTASTTTNVYQYFIPDVVTGITQTWSGSMLVKASTSLSVRIAFFINYSDSTQVSMYSDYITIGTTAQRIDCPAITSNPAKTITNVILDVLPVSLAVGNKIWATNAIVSPTEEIVPYFDGDSGSDHTWGALAHQSFSVKTAINDDPLLRVNRQYTSYLEFDPQSLAGTLIRATLRLFVRDLGTITVRAQEGTIEELPTFTGSAISTLITQVDEWIDVDITSLIITNGSYVIQLTSPDEPQIRVDFEGNTAPTLEVEMDPLSATFPQTLTFDQTTSDITNLITNPSFENGLTGWIAYGSAVITQVIGGTSGTYCARVSTTATQTGIQYSDLLPIEAGATFAGFSTKIRSISGSTSVQFRYERFDALGVSMGSVSTSNILLGPYWMKEFRSIAISGASYIKVSVVINSATASVFEIDSVVFNGASSSIATFDGDTNPAYWTGTPHASTSRLLTPAYTITAPYLGDSNENNTATMTVKMPEDTDFLIPTWNAVTNDRTNNYRTFSWPSLVSFYNYIMNPSFEVDDTYWTGGTRTSEDAAVGDYSYESTGLVSYTQPTILAASASAYIRARVKPAAGVSVVAHARMANSAYTTYETITSDPVYGDGTWKDLKFNFTTDELMWYMFVDFEGDGEYLIDAVQTSRGLVTAYRDGTFVNALWEGPPHKSMTALMIPEFTTFDFALTYGDEDGFYDANPDTTYVLNQSFTTPKAPDNRTTILPLEFVSDATTISVISPYEGDDNEDNSVRIEFRRTDLTTWSEVRPTYNRLSKEITSTITNLKQGTSYTIRVSYVDDDGTYGGSNGVVVGQAETNFLNDGTEVDPLVSFGGFLLMGRNDGKVGVVSHDAFGFPSRRMQIEELPRLDGSVERQALWGEKAIRINGYISGDSRSDLELVRKALLKALAPKQQRLIIDTMSHTGRFYYATCEALEIEEEAPINIRHLQWRATFRASDPFAYDTNETIVPTFSTVTNGTIALNNDGDTLANPFISITTPSVYPVSVVVINNTTGERISPKTTIISGDRLVIDVDRRSLTKNGVEVDYSGSFPRLGVGANTLRFTLAIIRTASTEELVDELVDATTSLSVDLRWRNKFL